MSNEIRKKIKSKLKKEHPDAKIVIHLKKSHITNQKSFAKLAKIQKKLYGKTTRSSSRVLKRVPTTQYVARIERKMKTEDGKVMPFFDECTFNEAGKQIKNIQRK